MSRQARSLDVLLAEVNAHAPNRSKASDGGLGDPAHASRDSDHNPNSEGVWRARDFTHDPAGGLNCNELATLLHRKLGSIPATRSGAYIIWNGRIVSTDRLDEGWRIYPGTNPHRSHLHISVATAAPNYDNKTPWNLWAREDWFEMATKDELRDVVREELARMFRDEAGDGVDIGRARIIRPADKSVTTLGHIADEIRTLGTRS